LKANEYGRCGHHRYCPTRRRQKSQEDQDDDCDYELQAEE